MKMVQPVSLFRQGARRLNAVKAGTGRATEDHRYSKPPSNMIGPLAPATGAVLMTPLSISGPT